MEAENHYTHTHTHTDVSLAIVPSSLRCLAKLFNHYMALSTELEKNTLDLIIMTHIHN